MAAGQGVEAHGASVLSAQEGVPYLVVWVGVVYTQVLNPRGKPLVEPEVGPPLHGHLRSCDSHVIMMQQQSNRLVAIFLIINFFLHIIYCTRYIALYCTVLHCTILYCTVLYCIILYCTVLYCVLHCNILYCTVLYCTVLYCTILYCIVLYCTVLYYTVLYSIVLYCTVLYCNILYCTVLYCTVLPTRFPNH